MSVVRENEEALKVIGGHMYKKCEEILNDLENQGKIKKLDFAFPPKQELKLKLKDILEDNVDEKYYLSDEQVNKIKYKLNEENVLLGGMQEHQSIKKDGICTTLTSSMGCGGGYVPMVTRKYGIFDTEKQTHQAGSVYDENGLAPTIDTMQGGWRQPCIEIKNNTKQGYLEATDGNGCYIQNIDKKRGTFQKEMIPTLKTSPDIGVCVNIDLKTKNKRIKTLVENTDFTDKNASFMDIYNQKVIENTCGTLKSGMDHQQGNIIYDTLRIRKLTPKECWRLMGFDDEDFEKAEKVNSNTQLYKQAGNSIVVNVLEAIFKNLLKDYLWSDLD